MAWLANLDTRAARWPRVAFWGYLFVRWFIVVVVVLAIAGAWTQNTLAPHWIARIGDVIGNAIDTLVVPVLIALALAVAHAIRAPRRLATTGQESVPDSRSQ